MKNYLAFLLIFMVFLFGCATHSPKAGDSRVSEERIKETANFSEGSYQGFWDTWPNDGVPLILGSSRRLMNREQEWEKALESAALASSVHHQVLGLSRFYTEKTSQGQGYLGDFQVEFDENLALEIKDSLEIVRKLQDHQGSYVIARYQGGGLLNLPPQPLFKGNPPEWVYKLPKIPGYLVSLGSSQRRQYLADSITAADLQALEEMVKILSMEITGQKSTIDSNGGVGTVHSSLEIARTTVRGFYILARWQSADGSLFFSLGICPENQN